MGIPLCVASLYTRDQVLCRDRAGVAYPLPVRVTLLEAPAAIGDWLLVHIDTAIAALSSAEAQQVGDALEAVQRAARGEAFEHLIADLVDSEPQLPSHLRAAPDCP